MKFLIKVFLMLAMLMALAITLSATPTEEEVFTDEDAQTETLDASLTENGEVLSTSLPGTGRFLAQAPRVTMTCNKHPRIYRAKGSLGPDCCKKKCVNVKTDRLNCGMCGKKCKYSEICCKGVYVSPLSNKKHCGGCNTMCKKRSSCVYGMCSYA